MKTACKRSPKSDHGMSICMLPWQKLIRSPNSDKVCITFSRRRSTHAAPAHRKRVAKSRIEGGMWQCGVMLSCSRGAYIVLFLRRVDEEWGLRSPCLALVRSILRYYYSKVRTPYFFLGAMMPHSHSAGATWRDMTLAAVPRSRERVMGIGPT
jgi:hypothetical protein